MKNDETDEEKAVEAFQAYKTDGLAGLRELMRKRNEEYREEIEGELGTELPPIEND